MVGLIFVWSLFRLNLDCAVDLWKELKDEVDENIGPPNGRNEMEVEGTRNGELGTLDVLLKSLWEGESITGKSSEEADNAFGDSVLDEDLDDMEIKIYSQISQKNNDGSAEEGRDLKLHNSEGNEKAGRKSFIGGFMHLNSDEDKSGTSTHANEGDDLPVIESIITFKNDSKCHNKEQRTLENQLYSHILSPASCSVSSVKSCSKYNCAENKVR